MPTSGMQISLLKRQAYLIALPVTLLTVLLTLALDMPNGGTFTFNQVALPLLGAALLGLTLLLYLRTVPLRWIEHGFFLVATATFLAKFGSLALPAALPTPDAEIAQVYIWAPFIYLLAFLIYRLQAALKRSLLIYGLSALPGVWAVVTAGPESLGNLTRLTEFYLASGLWLAMLYVLGSLKTQLFQLQARFGEMERLAHQDALTGLANRRRMETRLAQQAEQFQQYGLCWAVILFDIDHFKRVNDAHGHEQGDFVLQETARLMQYELRGTDQLARWGGEEFLILAGHSDLVHARALAERLRLLLARHSFGEVGALTASFGVAAYRDGESVSALMQRADEALYRAKRAGKNRVEVALTPQEPLNLPTLHNPFAARLTGPDPELCRETSAWLEQFGLGPGNAHARSAFAASFVGLAAALHPRACRTALRLTADWYSLMFLHDDRCDSSGIGKDPARLQSLVDRLLSVFQGGPLRPDDEPFAHALADVRGRLLAWGGPTWFAELTGEVRAYLNALSWEATNRADGTVPPLDEYLHMRPITAGLQIDRAFLEVMDGVRLPCAVRNHPQVQQLAVHADRAVCWSNDILSLEKELQDGDVHNLIPVLMHARCLSRQAALDEAARMYHHEVEQFLAGEQALPSFGPAEDQLLCEYAGLLRDRVGGILAWSHHSSRYQVAELVS